MPTPGRPRTRLGYLPRFLLGAGFLAGLMWGGATVVQCASEYRWRSFQSEAQERGLSLTLPKPDPALPVEENLAAESPFAPIPVDADGKPIRPPTLKNDLLPAEYLADLSRGKLADLTASAPQLQRCNLGDATGSDRDYAQSLLAACDRQMGANWARVLVAEARPNAQFNIRYWPVPMTQKVPVADFRTAVQTHVLRATAMLHLGRGPEAVEELRGGMRLVEALEADPSLSIYMLRVALVIVQMNVVWEGLNIGAWTDADLVALERMLGELELGLGYARAIETERGWVNAAFGELIGNPRSEIAKPWTTSLEPPIPFPGMRQWKHATIRQTQLLLNEHYDAVRERIDAGANWHGLTLPLDEATAKSNPLVGLAMIDFSKTEGRVLTGESRLRQARLALAIERYRRKTGDLPATLDDLVPDSLPELLSDPVDGKPMRYARDAARAYRLWSIGDDHEDDGGVADTEMCKMTLDTVWPGLVPGRKPKAEPPPDRGPRALRRITSAYAMAW